MKKLAITYLAVCALFYAALQCFAQVPSTHAGLGTPSSGGAVAPAFNWQNAASNGFFGSGTQTDVGNSSPAGSCGAFAAGDFLVSWVFTQGNISDTITIPSGWTTLGTQVVTAGTNVFKAAWKIASGSESCGAAGIRYTWTTSSFSSWGIADYTGANGTPLDGTPGTTTYATAGGASINMSGPTTATTPTALIAIIMSDATNAITVPADMTQRINSQQESGTVLAAMADKTLNATGATSEAATQTTFKTGAYALFAVTHP